MEITVIKRDGSEENYDMEKIARVAQAAGLRPIDAEEVSKNVTDWIEERGASKIKSTEIRDKVFQELEKIDSYASGLYAWYQSTKDKS